MDKTAILHIGTEKTGSTTIQNFLNFNRKKLVKQGFWIPDFLGSQSQYLLPFMVYGDEKVDDIVKLLCLENKQERCSLRKSLIERFEFEITNSNAPFYLFSSEHLSSRLTRRDELARLRDLLDKFFQKIIICVYLREPLSTAISLFSTLSISGGTSLTLWNPSSNNLQTVCNHMHLLQLWEHSFSGMIHPRLFQHNSLLNGDLLQDFADATGFFLDQELTIPHPVNESLSWFGMKVLVEFNKRFPPNQKNGISNTSRAKFINYARKIGKSSAKYLPTLDEFNSYNQYYNESNEWIRAKYFPSREKLWDKSVKPRQDSDNGKYATELSDNEEQLVRIICDIWNSEKKVVLDGYAVTLRDLSLKIDSGMPLGLSDALSVMEIAHQIRPNAPLISAKLKQLREKHDRTGLSN